ncbi:hypothetical protein [Pseudomonas oryzihabitans]|uniref:hypothetical protein n=1 Tax=Pseudomonas oryzihabitans TaxID=47885 RepID=UPI00285D9A39|nr:hypothetical protein [Pseudomonas psychrotolerans]MDR6676614.1 hypothetical protein [Pseudomonas psychrotolerans]
MALITEATGDRAAVAARVAGLEALSQAGKLAAGPAVAILCRALLVALMRGGEPTKAQALLDERLHRRPSQRDRRWQASLAL